MDRRHFLFLLLAGCTPSYQTVQTADLNIVDGRIHPYTLLSLERGDKRMQSFAQSPEKIQEEGFLRFRYEGEQRALWVDIAYEQTDCEAIFNKDLVRLAIKKLGNGNRRLLCQLQHNHPEKTLEATYREHFAEMIPFGIPQTTVEIASIPSSFDVVADMWLRKEAEDYLLSIEWSKIYVPTGVFDYLPTEGMAKLYNEHGLEGIDDVLTKAQQIGADADDVEVTLEELRKAGLEIEFHRQRELEAPILVE